MNKKLEGKWFPELISEYLIPTISFCELNNPC